MNSIICGDALEVLRTYEDNVFDAIVADPPSSIHFMNMAWDSNKGGRDQWIAWLTSIMREALCTLKPGGHCLVWALPRTSHWTATALEDAGLEIRDVIHHMYSADTALHDFLASLSAEQYEAFERLVESQGSSVLYSLFGSGFPKSLDVSKSIDAYHKAEREVVGTNEAYKARNPNGMTGTFRLGGCASIKELRHAAENKEKTPDGRDAASVLERVERERLQCQGANITAPATDAAKQYTGFGSALKPAAEHWILCRKPLSGRSIAENVLRWGVGALNIDASRIGTATDMNPRDFDDTRRTSPKFSGILNGGQEGQYCARTGAVPNGRFPANLMLSHSLFCTEERCADGCPILPLDGQSKHSKGHRNKVSDNRSQVNGSIALHDTRSLGMRTPENSYDDQGGASRYFAQFRPDVPPFYYAAKASRRERNAGLDNLAGSEGKTPDAPVIEKNHHPTVKSLSLMSYLVKLITPPNGVILDMFSGSGTTGVAAVNCGFGYVLIEQSPEYVEIARARVAHAEQQMAEKVTV